MSAPVGQENDLVSAIYVRSSVRKLADSEILDILLLMHFKENIR